MSANLPKLSNLPKINKPFNTYNAAKTSTNDTANTPLFGNSARAIADGFTSGAQVSSATQLDINLECEKVLNQGGSASNPFKVGGAATTAPRLNFAQTTQSTGEIGVLNNFNTNKTNNGTTKNNSQQIDLGNASKSEIQNYIDSFSESGKCITSSELNSLLANTNLDKSQMEGLYSLAMNALNSTEDQQEKENLKYLMSELEDRITGDSEWQEKLDKIKNAGSKSQTPSSGASPPSSGASPSGGETGGGGGTEGVDDSAKGLEDQLPVNFDDRISELKQQAQGTPKEAKMNELADGAKADKAAAQEKEAQSRDTKATADKARENANKEAKRAEESNKELAKKQQDLDKQNKVVDDKKSALNTKKGAESTAQKAYTSAQNATTAAQTTYDSIPNDEESASRKAAALSTLEQAKNAEKTAKQHFDKCKKEREQAEKDLKDAQTERDKLAEEIKKMINENEELKATADEWENTADALDETGKQQLEEAQELTNSANNKLQQMENLAQKNNSYSGEDLENMSDADWQKWLNSAIKK